jgi:hypothetical protein
MGIHDESSNIECAALEAEMRRRLWWALVIFDSRVSEVLDYKTPRLVLFPTWDCRAPLNVDDSELQSEMKNPPANHQRPTEAFFAVVHCELFDLVRRSVEGGELVNLEKTIEDKYLTLCDPDNSLQIMTTWTARSYLAKNHLLEHYSRISRSPVEQTNVQRNTAFSHALSMLECDTKLMSFPSTKRYHWLTCVNFPFFAYVHILQDLKERPLQARAEEAWDAMSNNYEARVMDPKQGEPIFIVFSRVVLHACEAREALGEQQGKMLEPPRIVSDIRKRLTVMRADLSRQLEQSDGLTAMSVGVAPILVPMDLSGFGPGGQHFAGAGPGGFPAVSGYPMMDFDMNQLWTSMDWSWMQTQKL